MSLNKTLKFQGTIERLGLEGTLACASSGPVDLCTFSLTRCLWQPLLWPCQSHLRGSPTLPCCTSGPDRAAAGRELAPSTGALGRGERWAPREGFQVWELSLMVSRC